ncbi:hypothetical protein BKA61DRAFT_577139 [Leptodontidium sp. MPI-SDFR-AT-0119]|nr:hypothetical protein BKA61DRAFT_577139 [Leptodontidium sp. MPI-SDFR-AT-0119]
MAVLIRRVRSRGLSHRSVQRLERNRIFDLINLSSLTEIPQVSDTIKLSAPIKLAAQTWIITSNAFHLGVKHKHRKVDNHHHSAQRGFYFFISGLESATPPVAHFEVKLQEAKESVFLSTRANNPLPADFDVNKLFHVYEVLEILQQKSIIAAHYGKQNPRLLRFSIDFVPSDDYRAMWEFGCDCHVDCASENPYDPLENKSLLISVEVNMKGRLGFDEPTRNTSQKSSQNPVLCHHPPKHTHSQSTFITHESHNPQYPPLHLLVQRFEIWKWDTR